MFGAPCHERISVLPSRQRGLTTPTFLGKNDWREIVPFCYPIRSNKFRVVIDSHIIFDTLVHLFEERVAVIIPNFNCWVVEIVFAIRSIEVSVLCFFIVSSQHLGPH